MRQPRFSVRSTECEVIAYGGAGEVRKQYLRCGSSCLAEVGSAELAHADAVSHALADDGKGGRR